jgi:opacity protein-like surface antigen
MTEYQGEKMKRLLLVLIVLVVSTGTLMAQDAPKAEVYGGFSMLNIDTPGLKITPFGWAASVNASVNKVVGIVGDFSGNYRDGGKFHSVLGGVQFTQRKDKASVFGQAKAGFVNVNGGGSSDSNFAIGLGGGVDWNANDKVAIRLIQIDWMPVKDTTWIKNVTRASAGVVFKVSK